MPQLEPLVQSAIDGKPRIVYVLARVSYLDSTVLGMLIRSYRTLGNRLRIVLPADSKVRRIFEITELERILAVVKTLGRGLPFLTGSAWRIHAVVEAARSAFVGKRSRTRERLGGGRCF